MINPSHEQINLPAATSEAALSKEIPFGLLWLQAVNPETFTPATWEEGYGHVRVILNSPTGQFSGTRIERYIGTHKEGGKTLTDEVHFAGDFNKISRLAYAFNQEGELIDYPTEAPNSHLQALVSEMSGLVHVAGSTILASSREFRQESSFMSDGTQGIDQNTGRQIAPPAAIVAAQLAIEPPKEIA